ncbi:hypothetical protein PTTG_09071 [Puccinia triticina 1-1 BBBD Race 1]|uniref:Uncharacterized protein n=1 Tax=Puccinia triticina (isolate 1-1 / race 1 (BBBD)) TaxID=630390 RepID=A0A180GZV4_PUCT1|nr:hypothetical protein PTTG_09071 [Puccinia triticina 1-1 BBBD Race 1]
MKRNPNCYSYKFNTVHSQESAGDQRQTECPTSSQAPVSGKGQVPKKGVLTRSAAKIGVPPNSEDTNSTAASTATKGKGPAQKSAEGPPETISLLGERSGPKGKTQPRGNNERANKRATIMAEALATTNSGDKELAAMLWEVYKAVASSPAPDEPARSVPAKHARDDLVKILGQSGDKMDGNPVNHKVTVLQEGDLEFDRAILHYAEKQPKGEESGSESRNRYTGLPYPSEWVQSFSEWTTNHQGFYIALHDVYWFQTFAGWVLIHKGHCD